MAEKTIGILGGMGPEATLDLFSKIIANTPAAKDQDHLRVVIDSNPKVPDRTAAILRGGESPVPAMKAGIQALKQAGADFVVIPCVSAHFFLDELQREATLPILSMLDVTAEHIRKDHLHIRTVGMLATTGTLYRPKALLDPDTPKATLAAHYQHLWDKLLPKWKAKADLKHVFAPEHPLGQWRNMVRELYALELRLPKQGAAHSPRALTP